jgi:hypothetical protein
MGYGEVEDALDHGARREETGEDMRDGKMKKAYETEVEVAQREAAKQQEEKEQVKREEELRRKKEEEDNAREKKRLEAEEKFKEKERLKKEEEAKFKEREEKRKKQAEERQAEEKRKKEAEEKQKEEERLRKIEEKKEKKRKEEETARKLAEEEVKKEDEKRKRLEEKKKKVEEAKARKADEEKIKQEELLAAKKSLEKDVMEMEKALAVESIEEIKDGQDKIQSIRSSSAITENKEDAAYITKSDQGKKSRSSSATRKHDKEAGELTTIQGKQSRPSSRSQNLAQEEVLEETSQHDHGKQSRSSSNSRKGAQEIRADEKSKILEGKQSRSSSKGRKNDQEEEKQQKLFKSSSSSGNQKMDPSNMASTANLDQGETASSAKGIRPRSPSASRKPKTNEEEAGPSSHGKTSRSSSASKKSQLHEDIQTEKQSKALSGLRDADETSGDTDLCGLPDGEKSRPGSRLKGLKSEVDLAASVNNSQSLCPTAVEESLSFEEDLPQRGRINSQRLEGNEEEAWGQGRGFASGSAADRSREASQKRGSQNFEVVEIGTSKPGSRPASRQGSQGSRDTSKTRQESGNNLKGLSGPSSSSQEWDQGEETDIEYRETSTNQQPIVGSRSRNSSRDRQSDTRAAGKVTSSQDLSKERPGTEGAGVQVSSRSGSRQTSRTGSPVSILKKGGSRDASRDRSSAIAVSGDISGEGSEGITEEDGKSASGLSRTGSLKKSGSFSRRTLFAEKKKISFDSDINVEQLEAAARVTGEHIEVAKEIFAAIANTSLEAGLSGRQRSRDTSHERPLSLPGLQPSLGTASPGEPADYFPPEGSEFDNEDELMIILDDHLQDEPEPELEALKSRSASRERPQSRSGIQRGGAAPGSRPNSKRTMVEDKYPNSLTKSRSGSGVPELEAVAGRGRSASGERWPSIAAEGSSRPSSTGFTHLDEFERKLAEMETEMEEGPAVDRDVNGQVRLSRIYQLNTYNTIKALNENPVLFFSFMYNIAMLYIKLQCKDVLIPLMHSLFLIC